MTLPKTIRFPTLIVGGKLDPLVPASIQIRDFDLLHAAAPNLVTLAMYEQAGHQLLCNQVVFQVIDELISRRQRASADLRRGRHESASF